MANAVFIAKLDPLEKVFQEVVNIIEDVKNDETIKQKTSLNVAQDVAQAIETNYVNYLNSISNFDHDVKNVTVYVDPTDKGYKVKVSGKEVLYHEYGTGTRGLENPHPKHNADGMKPYGSGRDIIHNGVRNDGKDLPKWYILYRDFPRNDIKYGNGRIITDFGNEPINRRDYVWRHNGIVTKGLPAGRFIYDACEEYRKEGSAKFKDKDILKRTVSQFIEDKIRRNIKRTTKQAIIKIQVDAKREEYRKLEEMRKAAGL